MHHLCEPQRTTVDTMPANIEYLHKNKNTKDSHRH